MEDDWNIMEEKEQIKYTKIDENQSFFRNIPNNIDEPYDFFKLIYTDSYINQIVINLNEYKEKKKKKYNEKNDDLNESISDVVDEKINKNRRCYKFSNMTFEHIEKYLAVEILMGIIKLPNVDDFWDKNPLLPNSISERIT